MNKPSVDTILIKHRIELSSLRNVSKRRRSITYILKNVTIKFESNRCLVHVYVPGTRKCFNYVYTLEEAEILHSYFKYATL